jgi:probable rRNA maturation factor
MAVPGLMLTEALIEDPRWQATELGNVAERAARATLQHLGLRWQGYEIAVLACDDARIAGLNAEFRDKPTPTNVLSWPAFDLAPGEEGAAPQRPPDPDPLSGEFLGDIAIAYETCHREARAAGKPFEAHVTHLMVHGVLHLLGYDHVRDGDATLMEGIEAEILGKLGIADPYS